MPTLVVKQLGRCDYLQTLELQTSLRDRVRDDPSVEYLVLVEHPPVVTLGRRADRSNVLVSEDELRRRGFELHETARGGDVTYHGPGQIVGYPIVDLNRHRTGLRDYMRLLEEVLIRTLAEFDVAGWRIDGLTGVWTQRGKAAAIGVAVRRWITYHGFALNVNTDLSHFRVITPCGISGRPVTSLAEILGREVDETAVRRVLEREFRAVFGFDPAADDVPAPAKRRLPPWLSKRLPAGGGADSVRSMLAELDLHTVCQSARCPNLHECFTRRTATFMILGSRCTRRCRFCAVTQGEPEPVDADEPARVAEAARRLGLAHVVVTSVTRDDLPDGGATQFARTIRAVREATGAAVEVLTPDFRGDETSVRTVLEARPEVYSHNVETVPALYETVRPGADYARSVALLRRVRELDPGVFTKSGLMLGLGESADEVLATLADLRVAGCDLLTLGQYLAPSKDHLPVARFVPPEEFADLADKARAMGFAAVASAPFVRSSHDAAALYAEAQQNRVELT